MLVAFKLLDGSAAAPGLSFTNETTMGIYRVAASTLGFSTASTLRWSVNSVGKHVIAVPSSGNTFEIDSLTGSQALLLKQSAGGGAVSMSLVAGYDYRIVSNNTGNLSITNATLGTTPLNIGPTGALTIAAPTSGNNATINSLGGTTALGLVSTTAGFTALDITDGQAGTRRWEIISGYPAVGAFCLYDATAAATRLSIDTSGNTSIQDGSGNSYKAGFRELPLNLQTGTTYTLVQNDNNKSVYMNAAGAQTLTVPSLAANTIITVLCDGGAGQTVSRSGVSLYWFPGSARSADANRTVANGSVYTLWWYSATVVLMWGNGIT
jgi:hypothetical protein